MVEVLGGQSILLGLLVLTTVLVVIELRRGPARSGFRQVLRYGSLLVALLGLAWLVTRPVWRAEASSPTHAIIVTEGADLDEDAGAGESSTPVFFLTGDAVEGAGTEQIPDLATLHRRVPGLERLEVIGDGLDHWAWTALEGVEVERRALPPELVGMVDIHWQRQLMLGERLVVSGRLHTGGRAGVLDLAGPAGTESTQSIEATNEPVPFVLATTPRVVGRTTYRLIWRSDAAEHLQTIAFEVTTPPALRVLWLEDAPRFDTRFVFDHVAALDVEIAMAVRSRLSRDRFRTAFYGLEPLPVDRLSPDLLNRFDLLVVDGEVLLAFDRAERRALEAAITDEGLGLLLVPSETLERALDDPLLPFELETMDDLEVFQARLRLDERVVTEPLELPPRILRSAHDSRPLAVDPAGRWLAADSMRGRGRVAVSLVDDSFRWVLEGAADHYAYLWSRLLGDVARGGTAVSWSIPEEPVVAHRPLRATVTTDDPLSRMRMTRADGTSIAVPLEQDRREPDRWHVTVWPRDSGWIELSAESTDGSFSTVSLWVDTTESWPTWQRAERQRATQAATLAPVAPVTGSVARVDTRRPLPRLLGYLLLVVGMAWLWLDERLGVNPT